MTVDIDVVIPVRDVDRYLGEALQSVRDQIGVSCAVTVVDAGSTSPIALPSAFVDDPAVRLVRSETPLLVGAARNLGAGLGTAPWLSFLDADDRWPPPRQRALVDACAATGAGIAAGTMRTFHSDEASARLAAADGLRTAYLAGGIVVSREVWKRLGPFDPDLRAGEFVDWLARARAQDIPIATIPDLVLERRLHLESTTAGQIGNRDDYLRVVRRWMKRNG